MLPYRGLGAERRGSMESSRGVVAGDGEEAGVVAVRAMRAGLGS
jgi:hypothetical protein